MLSREQIAMRVAQEFKDGDYVIEVMMIEDSPTMDEANP